MFRIIILNTASLDNKGSMGRVEGIIKCLEEAGCSDHIVILHRYYKQDRDTHVRQLLKKYPNVDIQQHPWFREEASLILTAVCSLSRFCLLAMRYKTLRLFGKQPKGEIQSSDVIVDLNLIEPAEGVYATMTLGAFFALIDTWHATMTGKSVLVCSATIGPYNNSFLRHLARYVLNKVDAITLREKYSFDYLRVIDVTSPQVYLSADLAFLMDGESYRLPSILKTAGIVLANKPIVGITVSAMLNPSLEESVYIRLISELTDFLIDHLINVTIVFITHTYQDAKITQSVYARVKNKQKVNLLPTYLTAAETKSVIGICDLFICSRFHALVASTSLAIPSLGIVAYSKGKFHGIIGEIMGQENYLVDVPDNLIFDEFLFKLKSKVMALWANREIVAQDLLARRDSTKSQVLFNGRLVKELAMCGKRVN
jgi:polysaccharide pyruvyl transferase WcaK-like protein